MTWADIYASTLGPTGHALRHVPADVIGGAGQAYNDFTGGVRGFYAGTGQVLNRTGNAAAEVVESSGVAIVNLSNAPKDVAGKVATPFSFGVLALIALGAYLLLKESKTGTVTRAATEGATKGATHA